MEQLMTVKELAAYLRTPTSWIYSRTRQKGPGRIPHIRAGKYCLFKKNDILEWLEKQQDSETT